MILGGSWECYLLVAHRVLDFLGALVDYLFRMTWMIVTSRVLLMLMMLITQIPQPGNLLYFVFIIQIEILRTY